MAKCKNCGEGDKLWTQNEEGKWRMLNADGSAHRCMGSGGFGGAQQQQQQERRVPLTPAQQMGHQQVQQPSQPQQQQHPTAEEWTALFDKINKMSETLGLYAQFYEGLVSEMQSISKSVHKSFLVADKADQFLEQAKITDAKIDRLLPHFKRVQELARQEEEYDRDREDGTIGFG